MWISELYKITSDKYNCNITIKHVIVTASCHVFVKHILSNLVNMKNININKSESTGITR